MVHFRRGLARARGSNVRTAEFCLARIGSASVTVATEKGAGSPHPSRVEKEPSHGPTDNLPALSHAATLPEGVGGVVGLVVVWTGLVQL